MPMRMPQSALKQNNFLGTDKLFIQAVRTPWNDPNK